ncbi:hypothetical protein AMATHDRAFT_44982 [Amanita thiersii Skay4041]|uniref:HTH CENPB-type domain-containing protein n=1 Tax=Amanita thiersii Skay4041 TaxID=703135 RepID=A0A2A9P0M2_9AGAR|nr:hypothetical protein AMATHDRAFT_44982 [Amanita thiersii Skay4041]
MDGPSLPPYSSPSYPLTEDTSHIDPGAHSIHAFSSNSRWPQSHLSPVHHNSLFPPNGRASDLDYPSPAPSIPSPPYQRRSQQHPPMKHLAITSDKDLHTSFPQVDSVIGPDRVLTRRQRAALEQGTLGRRLSVPANYSRADRQDPLPTPVNFEPQSQRDRLSLNIRDTAPVHTQSPGYKPMTPTSLASPYSPTGYYSSHTRSLPSLQVGVDPRPNSPTNSNTSIFSSISLSGGGAVSHTSATSSPSVAYPSVKHKKQRLTNADRRNICLYADQNPDARQEDMATIWKVERSTVSKILKNKDKWLNIPDDVAASTSKSRPSKFPEIEELLWPWVLECSNNNTAITDSLIRAKAREAAQKLNISEERFKASSGWIENFKLRNGIKNGNLTEDVSRRAQHLTDNNKQAANDVDQQGSLTGFSVRNGTSDIADTTLPYPHSSWTGYTQPERNYPSLEASAVLRDPPTSQSHIRSDDSPPSQFPATQHPASSHGPEPVPMAEEAYEAIARLLHFLDQYPRKEYLVSQAEEHILRELTQRLAKECAGTLIDDERT